jgi:hypothetical protein
MNYEINIALNGSHFFATHQRSITDEETLIAVFEVLNLKFPSEEGYHITVSYNPGIIYSHSRDSVLTAIEINDVESLFKKGR